uniref:Chitin-binding type-2 domain-containing protein n=1 Tax=Glossina pallidipes TaxID=7398 RepID=A0A1A9ZBG6_GLOPL
MSYLMSYNPVFKVLTNITVQYFYSQKEEFQCPSNIANGNYADPVTCRRFYQCVDGFPYLNRCPSGLYFDDVQKFCTFKDEAKCGPLSTTPATVTDAPVDKAQKCNTEECQLPYCFCSKDGTQIPGGLEADKIPQMIMLTFDGAVNLNNYDHYSKIFNGKRKNPNGCNIRASVPAHFELSTVEIPVFSSESFVEAEKSIFGSRKTPAAVPNEPMQPLHGPSFLHYVLVG